MSEERRDALHRVTSTAGAVRSLVEIIESNQEPLQETWVRVAHTAVGALPAADAVSITVVSPPRPRTVAYTDERVLRLDEQQYQTRRGPCLEAAHTRSPVRVSMGRQDQRWPEFAAAARSEGIVATLSIPLIVDTSSPAGADDAVASSLNVYSRTRAGFDAFDEVLMGVFATTASQVITATARRQRSQETVAHLQAALVSRSEIDQAKGVLRAVHGCSAEEAFAMLVAQSQHHNLKVHLVATQLLDSVSAHPERTR